MLDTAVNSFDDPLQIIEVLLFKQNLLVVAFAKIVLMPGVQKRTLRLVIGDTNNSTCESISK